MHKTHANSLQRIVIDNKQTRPAGSHAVQWPIVHHTPQLPCAALPERGRRNGMSTARTKWCDVRNAAMERRARRATAMKMTKTMSNDGDQTWWTAVEARLLAPWSTQNCALKRKRQPCECRSDERSGPRMTSMMSNDGDQTRRTAAEARLLPCAVVDAKLCSQAIQSSCRRLVVAIPSRRNLASVEAMKGVGREAHSDDKMMKTMSTDGYHTRRWAASWSETSTLTGASFREGFKITRLQESVKMTSCNSFKLFPSFFAATSLRRA